MWGRADHRIAVFRPPGHPRALIIALLVGLLSEPVTAVAAEPPAEARDRTLVLGRVSENARTALPRIQRMADYLAHRLADVGVVRGGGVVAHDNADMIRLLRQGAVDLVSETVLSALLFAEATGARIILREWKQGVGTYRSLIIVRKDGPVSTLSDLRGRRFAFEDPGSTTGYLWPLAVLDAHGLELVRLRSFREQPPENRVGYVFARKEISVVAAVILGRAAAGALNDGDWMDQERTPERLRQQLRPLFTSGPIIRSVVLARGTLRPAVVSRVREALLAAHQDPEAREVLRAYYRVGRYDALEGAAADQLDRARAVLESVRGAIQ